MEHLSRNLLLLAFIALLASCGNKATHRPPVAETVVVAYVTSWTDVQPDPSVMTHINYAFGHVNETFDGVRIDNPQRLRSVVALKEKVPSLQVLLSVGGWESGGFSEMAADEGRRQRFADDCARAVLEYGLDGIDIDWEYPTQNVAGISASPHDTDNFTLLMRDLRHALGEGKLLTLATVCSAKYFDFPAFLPYVDFVNVMAYDMGSPNGHHAALYPSEHSGTMTSHEAVQAHLEAGVPAEKLVMGMPFYGRGRNGFPAYADSVANGLAEPRYTELWDSTGMFPYFENAEGAFVYGYENAASIAAKCEYILANDLLGGMYWEYADDKDGSMRNTVAGMLLGTVPDGE